MSEKTLTRSDLASGVYNAIGLSRRESSKIVQDVFDEVSASLIDGEEVKIAKFGTFSVHEKSQRIGRNPKTGQEVPISPRKVVRFKASDVLKTSIKGGE